MTLIKLGDSASPPASYPAVDGWGFYIGGNTPHAWLPAEVARAKVNVRYLLPIFTRSNPAAASPAADAAAALATVRALGQPAGTLIAWDLEAAVDPTYVTAVDELVTAAGYRLVIYGQLSTVTRNPAPAGGYWVGDWDGADADPSWTGKQYTDAGPWDLSEFDPAAPLWDTRPPAPTPPAPTPPTPTVATLEDEDMQQIEPTETHPGEYAYGAIGKSRIVFCADGYSNAPAKLRVVFWVGDNPQVHDGVTLGGTATKAASLNLPAGTNAVTVRREDTSAFPVSVQLP